MTARAARRVFQVDAFTTEPLTGNAATVVLDTDGLDTATMQAIAREFNNSETAFLFPPTADDHGVYLRYFTPTVEVPLCGHATLAAHYVRAWLGLQPPGFVAQRSAAGVRRVEVAQIDRDYTIRLHLGRPELSPPLPDQAARRIRSALGLSPATSAPWPMQIVSTGHSKVLVGVDRWTTLRALRPDYVALAAISAEIDCNGYHCFTLEPGDTSVLTESRMFAPAIGIAEDPVTGNGHGPLGAYLVAHALVPTNGRSLSFWGLQGVTMGRPGRVRVEVSIDGGPTEVTVGERAVIVFDGVCWV